MTKQSARHTASDGPGGGDLAGLRGASILIVLNDFRLGGAEKQAVVLGRRLAADYGADVRLWAVGGGGPVEEFCREQGLRWGVLPLRWPGGVRNSMRRLGSFVRFARELRRARPDVILPFTIVPNVVCGLAWRLSGASLCVWNQRDVAPDGDICPWLRRRAARRLRCFVANSSQAARHLAESAGIDEASITIIPNGVEAAPAHAAPEEWRRRLDADEKTIVACMVANLSARKDHATLLRAWALARQQLYRAGQPPVLVLAGRADGLRECLQRCAEALGVAESVRLVGEVADVTGLLSAADFGLYSSRGESCPNGVLECMAAGLAVAGTDVEGIRWLVGKQGRAMLAPPGDAEALAQRMVALATEASLRARLGEAGRRRVGRHFAAKRMARQWAELIAAGLAAASSQGRWRA